MKQLLILIGLMLIPFPSLAQEYDEFKKNKNGLMYDESTMNQLKFIVDSLNLKFKVCELEREYRAESQAIAHFVKISGSKALKAKKDIENNISFEELKKKYPKAEVEENLLVTRVGWINYSGEYVFKVSDLILDKAVYKRTETEVSYKLNKETLLF